MFRQNFGFSNFRRFLDRTINNFSYVELYMDRAIHIFSYVEPYMDRTIHICSYVDVAGGRQGSPGVGGGGDGDGDGDGDAIPTTLPSGQTPGPSRPGTKYPVRDNPSLRPPRTVCPRCPHRFSPMFIDYH